MSTKSNQIDQVIARDHQWAKTHLSLDLDLTSDILSEDYQQIRSDGSVIGKEQLLASYRSGEREWQMAGSSDHEVQIVGELAIVIGTWRGIGVDAGKFFDYSARFLSIYSMENKSLKMIYDVSIPISN